MKLNKRGYDWWTLGAQKGIQQPPYIVRDRGRWWRTPPLYSPNGESVTPEILTALRQMPHLVLGFRRCMDYLERTGKQFRDLPLWEPKKGSNGH